MSLILQSAPDPLFLTCSFCRKPVQLEIAKTDENGKAIHEDCYVLKMQAAIPEKTQG